MTKFQKNKQGIAEVAGALLSARGWREDRWGNWKSPSSNYRVKFQPRVVRIERKFAGWRGPEWKRIASLGYSDFDFGKFFSDIERIEAKEMEEA